MLTLLLGEDWVANSAVVFDRIAQDVANKQGGRILIVPELISHESERNLCLTAGDTASRFAQVLSFTRLTKRVADYVGHATEDCLDDGGRIVALAAAAQQLHSKLKAYAAVETRPEFLSDLLDAIDEFKRCCISSRDLHTASKNLEGTLAQKLEELALLLDCYDGICQRGRKDPRDLMTWLLEELESSSFANDHVFYIDGFPDFTQQNMAILEHLMRESKSVTVSLNCDCPNSNKIAYEKAANTASELIRRAKQMGIAVSIETIKPRMNALQPLREYLFQGNCPATQKITELSIEKTDSVYHECTNAALRIHELVQNGASYKDICVVTSDQGTYGKILEMVFERCKIPCYIAGTESVLDKTVVSSILSAIETALSGFEKQDVVQYLKSFLSPLDQTMCDRMENYAFMWGITGKAWLEPWKKHPYGLNHDFSEESEVYLEELNAAREKAVEPLQVLRDRFRQAKNLADQVNGVYEFFEQIDLAGRLGALSDEFEEIGDYRSAQIFNQLWEILLSALEQLHAVLGNTTWQADAFVRLFKLLLSQYNVGTIPHVLDSVTVGPVNAMRCQHTKHLIALGLQEGKMPGYSGSVGILSDQERKTLRNLGVPLTGGSLEGLQAEFSEIYGVFCGVEESVMVSCPGGQPSFIFRRLSLMAADKHDYPYEIGTAFGDALEAGAFFLRMNAQEAAVNAGVLAQYKEMEKRRDHSLGVISQDNVKKLYGDQLRLSASQIDKQAECRMSYFLRYGLRLKEQKKALIDPAEYGTFVHAVLENTARDINTLGGFHSVSLEQTLEIAQQHAAAYTEACLSQVDTQRLQYLFRRNGQELALVVRELWSELNNSDFDPVGFEVGFGDGEQMPAIRIDGKNMQAILRGFVDRVDVWKTDDSNVFRVVDYKTGKKDLDYCDLYNGLGLQMLLYLFALEQEGADLIGESPVSAGVQYFPARVPVISADSLLDDEEASALREREWKRKGLVLQDETVLHAMQLDERNNRMPYTRKKDGSISGDLADTKQLQMLKKYIFKLLGKFVDEIASGCIEPNPYTRGNSHDACAFCPYDGICHLENVSGRRNYKTISAQQFWQDIAMEVNECG